MSTLKSSLFAALSLAALAGAASAHPQLTDAQYLAAARCQALMSSATLGKVDSGMIDGVMKTEGGVRSPAVLDRADGVRQDVFRAANHAGPNAKAALISERDGACASMAHGSMVAMAVSHSNAR